MGRPRGIGVVDLMMGIPSTNRRWWADSMGPLLLDKESRGEFQHAASYMFKDLPEEDGGDDPVGVLLREMDAHGIERGLIPVALGDPTSARAVRDHPDRLWGSFLVDPNLGMETVRERSSSAAVFTEPAASTYRDAVTVTLRELRRTSSSLILEPSGLVLTARTFACVSRRTVGD